MTYSQGKIKLKETSPKVELLDKYYRTAIIIMPRKRKNAVMNEESKFSKEMKALKKNQRNFRNKI